MEDLIIKLIILIINLVGIWLAILINIHKPKRRIVFLFSAMVVLMLIWVNFAYLSRITHPDYGLSFIRLAWSITPLFFVFIYFFIKDLLRVRKEKCLLFEKLLVVFGIINIPIVFQTSLVIQSILFDQDGILIITYGKGIWIFFGSIFLLTALSFYALFRAYIKSPSKKMREKAEYLLVGFSFFFLMNSVFNIILPVFFQIFHLYEFGDYSTIILLSFFAYAIVKKELFGIKIVLTYFLVGLIVILLAIGLIFSPPGFLQLLMGLILLLFIYSGYMLIKSVSIEIKRREDLEDKTKKLKKAYGELKKLDNAKSTFVALTSHQLRTPLTAIKGYISMIIDGDYGRVSKETVEPLQAVYSSNERLIGLVNDLLDLSKIDAGKMELNKEKAYLEDIIISIIDELKFNAEEKGLSLRFEKSKKKLARVLIDKSRIRQVFLNIIDNAIKYTDEGEVSIRVKKIGDIQQVEIRDTGMGIERDYLPHLFDSFQRGKSSRKVVGSGLGLHIAKKFVKMHNGDIWAESPIQNREKGSIFYITFPIK